MIYPSSTLIGNHTERNVRSSICGLQSVLTNSSYYVNALPGTRLMGIEAPWHQLVQSICTPDDQPTILKTLTIPCYYLTDSSKSTHPDPDLHLWLVTPAITFVCLHNTFVMVIIEEPILGSRDVFASKLSRRCNGHLQQDTTAPTEVLYNTANEINWYITYQSE